MPLLLPLLYQLGLGLPAWQSGLLMMPVAAGAMGMKLMAGTLLRRFGYRRVLAGNTLLVGVLIAGFSEVGLGTPLLAIVLLSLALGHLHSLQFASLNTLVFADVEPAESAGASTLAATLQHLGLSFGLACGSLLTALFLGAVPQSNQLLVTHALHHAFLVLAAVTMLSSLVFRGLGPRDGENVSGGA
jgi:MFS family permease